MMSSIVAQDFVAVATITRLDRAPAIHTTTLTRLSTSDQSFVIISHVLPYHTDCVMLITKLIMWQGYVISLLMDVRDREDLYATR